MKVLVTGASGLLGSALVSFLSSEGHDVKRAVRQHEKENHDTVFWDPDSFSCKPEEFEGFDAVINLSGENIFSAIRWNEAKKQKILNSRVKATQALCSCFDVLEFPPKILINASAVGYYGNQNDAILTEKSPSGTGFLADVCRHWEDATEAAQQLGIRVVRLRLGTILTPTGGALKKMLPPFKLGLGGNIGSGQQYMSWIAMGDLLRAISHVLRNDDLKGPVNVVTPYPVTNMEFTKALGKILRRPTGLCVPAFLVRLIFGELGEEILLSSTRVIPSCLQQTGFVFKYPYLEDALHHMFHENNYG